jgi:heme-degrading monooxygenase HmoA
VLVVLWDYRVRRDRLEEFEALYRPDGEWTGLLRQSPAFVSTTLWKDHEDPLRYVVADRWTSATVMDEFVRERAAEYATLSERGARLFEREVRIGRFDLLD